MGIMLTMHPKVIARQRSISAICKRDPDKSVSYVQRIPLGRRVYHEYAGEEADVLFSDKKFVKYKDGSLYLHVELMCNSGDGYHVGNDGKETKVVNAAGGLHGIPEEVFTPATPQRDVEMDANGEASCEYGPPNLTPQKRPNPDGGDISL